jgi:hypothetical protein
MLMDKAMILGVFNFVSFHMCKTLLNSGVEVCGVSFGNVENIPFHEEKRLEVGRNANFTEATLEELTKDVLTGSKHALMLSVYDFYMLHHDQTLLKDDVTQAILEFINKNNTQLDILVILPMQFINPEKKLPIIQFLSELKQQAKNIQEVYLPTIYGPWQPLDFLFQQAIMSTMQKGKLTGADREWRGDALFVDDAVETILDIMEIGKPGEYLLESGKDDYWQICADYLEIEQSYIDSVIEPLELNRNIVRTPVKKLTALADSFAKQLDHTKLIYQSQS